MVEEIHTETSSLTTLNIMPRNLKEIVRSWIRLLNALEMVRISTKLSFYAHAQRRNECVGGLESTGEGNDVSRGG
jgi:hypothetical protein